MEEEQRHDPAVGIEEGLAVRRPHDLHRLVDQQPRCKAAGDVAARVLPGSRPDIDRAQHGIVGIDGVERILQTCSRLGLRVIGIDRRAIGGGIGDRGAHTNLKLRRPGAAG